MIIETLSTFPDMYESVMGASMMRIARKRASWISRRTTCAIGRTTAIAPPTTSRMAAATAWS